MILLLTKIVVCTTFVKWRQIFSEQIVQFVLSVFTMQCVSPPSSNVSSWDLLNDRACYRLHPKPAPSSSADPVSDRKINVQPSDKSPEGKEYARSTRFSNNTHTVESGNEGHINKRDKAIKAHWPRKWRWTSYLKALRQRLPGQRLSHCVRQCVAVVGMPCNFRESIESHTGTMQTGMVELRDHANGGAFECLFFVLSLRHHGMRNLCDTKQTVCCYFSPPPPPPYPPRLSYRPIPNAKRKW